MSIVESHQPSKFGLKKIGAYYDNLDEQEYIVAIGGRKSKPGITVVDNPWLKF